MSEQFRSIFILLAHWSGRTNLQSFEMLVMFRMQELQGISSRFSSDWGGNLEGVHEQVLSRRWWDGVVAVEQGWSGAAECISEDVHAGSHLARHHCSGEQLVQLNQFVGRGVKLERNAVQRVPRFHLDDKKTKERTQKSHARHLFTGRHMKDAAAEAERVSTHPAERRNNETVQEKDGNDDCICPKSLHEVRRRLVWRLDVKTHPKGTSETASSGNTNRALCRKFQKYSFNFSFY